MNKEIQNLIPVFNAANYRLMETYPHKLVFDHDGEVHFFIDKTTGLKEAMNFICERAFEFGELYAKNEILKRLK